LSLNEFLTTIWRRKITIVFCVVVATAAAWGYATTKEPSYQSNAVVTYAATATTNGSASPFTPTPPLAAIASTAVAEDAAHTLHDSNVAATQADVTGVVDPVTGAFTVTATASQPAQAQAIAQAYATALVNSTQAASQAQITKINSIITQLEQQISTINDPTSPQVVALNSSISSLEAQQAAIEIGEPYATLTTPADLPGAPVGYSSLKLAAIGAVAGLLLGIGLALIRSRLDQRMRSAEYEEEEFHLPVLGEVPRDVSVKKGEVAIALVQAPQSPLAESMRDLRTSLRVAIHETSCPVVAVTSPEPGEGKSFVAANLAAAWAMSGSRVIMVSADLRRPKLETTFDGLGASSPGFSDLISANWHGTRLPGGEQSHAPGAGESADRETDALKYLLDTGIWGLRLLPAGQQRELPSELFGSPGLSRSIEQLTELADLVIIDTPPVLAAADTPIIANHADGTIIVVNEGSTDRRNLERSLHRLGSTNSRVFGLVFNQVRLSSKDPYLAYSHQP